MNGHIRAIFAGLLLLLAWPAASALAQAGSLKDQLVGQWQLVSVTINDTSPYGANPSGAMLLDAGGHYAVIVVSVGGAKNIAYYGTYTVDEASKTLTAHVAGSTRPKADGRDQKHTMSLSGDQLTDEMPIGRKGSVKMIWKRANSSP